MLLKLLTLLGLIVTLVGAFRRARALTGLGNAPPARSGAADMARCTQCGAWHDPGTQCGCHMPYTP